MNWEYLQRNKSGFWQRAILEKGETLTIQCNDDYHVVLTLDLIYEEVDLI